MNTVAVVYVVVVLALLVWLFTELAATQRRNDLEFRLARARHDLLPLLDDTLYRTIKAWRRRFPNKDVLYIGKGKSEADRLYRALCRIGLTPRQKREFAELANMIGAKFDASIRLVEMEIS